MSRAPVNPERVLREVVDEAFHEGYNAGCNDAHPLARKGRRCEYDETKAEIVRAALARLEREPQPSETE